MICTYENCRHNRPSDDPSLCVFHAPAHHKGVSLTEFNQMVFQLVRGTNDNFRGFVFPSDIEFNNLIFNQSADFSDAVFENGSVAFRNVQFSKMVHFDHNAIVKPMEFQDITFGSNGAFQFSNPIIRDGDRGKTIVRFENVTFPSFTTFFKNIHAIGSAGSGISAPVFLFRDTCLENVYFDDVDMSLFSFYKSTFFENAHFMACHWPEIKEPYLLLFTQTKKNIIADQWLFSEMQKKTGDDRKQFIKQFSIETLHDYREIAGLYRRLKTSFDRAKDYEEAAWQYFNEVDMKRLSWWNEWLKNLRNIPPRLQNIPRFFYSFPPLLWSVLYTIYRWSAGYGERPLYSLLWFVLWIPIFGALHLLNGLKVFCPDCSGGFRIIDYNLGFPGWKESFLSAIQFFNDLSVGIKYSILRLIPPGYSPIQSNYVTPAGTGLIDIVLPLTNTIVLWLLISYFAIALRRHFRRY